MEDSYTVRELDAKFAAHAEMDHHQFGEINGKLDDHFEAHTTVLKDILEQTTKTNGSVAKVKQEQSLARGALYMLSGTVTLLIFPIVGFVLWRVVNLDNQVRQVTKEVIVESIAAALQDYEKP